ncbi:MAG: 50S ribosomal protein L25, partial [Parcubacteria group bacterium GW2011_GWF2_39_13b]
AEKAKNVLIHEIAKDPLTGEIIHVDFQEIRMDEKLTATVPVVFVGESPAVKGDGGTLVKNIKEVQVKAFAKDFPRQIEVDISVLKTFDDRIQVKDLLVSSEVKILAQPEETVALVSPPRKEEAVVEVAPAAGEAEKPAEEAAPGEPLAKKEE